MKKLIIFTSNIYFILFAIGCNSSTEPSGPSGPTLPPLTEEIPYEILGSGKIVFERIGPPVNNYQGVYVIDIDNRKVWGISGGAIHAPNISPNGDKIAYTKLFNSERFFDVFLMDINGKNRHVFSNTKGSDKFPEWSPDGTHLYFYYWNASKQPAYGRLVKQSLAASGDSYTVVKNWNSYPWHPQGPISISNNYISYITDYHRLNILTIQGEYYTGFTVSDGDDIESPIISPSENNIVYLQVEKDYPNPYQSISVKIISLTTLRIEILRQIKAWGNREWSNPGQANTVSICFSPDGTKLLFNVPEGDLVSHLYVMNVDGSSLVKLTTLEGISDRFPSWSK